MFSLALTGYPLSHSLSPKIHAAALKDCGLSGEYNLLPIPPGDLNGLTALLNRLRGGELQGFNVTIPHKQTILPLLDALTPAAQAIGAVNTVFGQNGQAVGDNTDAPGFLADLRHCFPSLLLGKAQVLGAGGSARAVVYALTQAGWQVSISARRAGQAEELARLSPLATSQPLPQWDLLVNTTPLGMTPQVESTPWQLPFPPGAVVYDLVYNPSPTRLVSEARAAGLPAQTGLGMLVEQAALAFQRWTGCSPSRAALMAAVK